MDPRTVRAGKEQKLMTRKDKVSDNSSQCTLDPSVMLLTASHYTGAGP